MPSFKLGDILVGDEFTPLCIAEIGINHEGDFSKAEMMVRDAAAAGAQCVKLQTHVIEDEMIPNDVIPGNATESIWDIMSRCVLSKDEEARLKDLAEELGVLFLSTPFSRAAADQLEKLGVDGYKIGSGECNNYPLVSHIAAFGKPVILSTGMNSIETVRPSVEILEAAGVPYALLHCTSMYPTPYEKVRLNAITDLREAFPNAVLGLSDHSMGIWTCLGAVPFGASILEKHFTSDRSWPGPDVPISILPEELADMVQGSRAIHAALGGEKSILFEEQPTIDFAYASVVTIASIKKGDSFSMDNIWVKRPGTGEFLASDFDMLLGRKAVCDIGINMQLTKDMVQ